ncbi:MAG: SatD family protein [Calditrichia bacterium]
MKDEYLKNDNISIKGRNTPVVLIDENPNPFNAMTNSEKYCVLIGDISGSKRLTGMDRYQTQLFVKSAIVQTNEQFGDYIDAPMTITKGDEFQGLFHNAAQAVEVVQSLQKMVFPIRIRYGLGVGNIYRMGGNLPIEMDGPAFHRANRALNMAKKRKSDMWFISEEEMMDQLVNTIFALISAIRSRWNERHFKLYWKYLELGTYREVAREEDITPQAVGDMLKNIRATDVLNAEKNVIGVLARCYPEMALIPDNQ